MVGNKNALKENQGYVKVSWPKDVESDEPRLKTFGNNGLIAEDLASEKTASQTLRPRKSPSIFVYQATLFILCVCV